jgi:hypothetical protein
MVKPFLRGLEPISLFDLLRREIVKRPHPLFSARCRKYDGGQHTDYCFVKETHSKSILMKAA